MQYTHGQPLPPGVIGLSGPGEGKAVECGKSRFEFGKFDFSRTSSAATRLPPLHFPIAILCTFNRLSNTGSGMHLELWQIIVLGVIQGVTEFLPISSDGHLVVAAALMAPGGNMDELDIPDLIIVLHSGTLLSILVFYWQRIVELIRADRRTIGLLLAATVPAVGVGLPAKLYGEALLGSAPLTGLCLILTGVVLLVARSTAPGTRHYRELGLVEAVAIGLSQAAAILPGLSRSGCTITTGLRLGLSPISSATFSFLMAIPVIAGACLVESVTIWKEGGISTPVSYLLVGVGISFVVGLGALWWLVRWLERGRFALFAWWCIPLGIVVLIWQFSIA